MLKGKEKLEFFDRAFNSRQKLGKKILEYNNKKEKEKQKLEDKVYIFLYAIKKLNEYYSIKYKNGEIKDNAPIEILWMIDNPRFKSEDISILLGKYLKIDNYRLIRFRVIPDNEEKKSKFSREKESIFYQVNNISIISFDYCYFNMIPSIIFIHQVTLLILFLTLQKYH